MDDRKAVVREYLLGLLDKALPETACFETVNFRELRNLLEASVELQIECAERSTNNASTNANGANDEAVESTEAAEVIEGTEPVEQTESNGEDERIEEIETNEEAVPSENESEMSEEAAPERTPVEQLPEEVATPKAGSAVTSPRSSIPEQQHDQHEEKQEEEEGEKNEEENAEENKEGDGHLKVVIKVPKGLVCNNREQTEFEFSVRDSHQKK